MELANSCLSPSGNPLACFAWSVKRIFQVGVWHGRLQVILLVDSKLVNIQLSVCTGCVVFVSVSVCV